LALGQIQPIEPRQPSLLVTCRTRTRWARVGAPSRSLQDYAGQLKPDGISPWRLSTSEGGKQGRRRCSLVNLLFRLLAGSCTGLGRRSGLRRSKTQRMVGKGGGGACGFPHHGGGLGGRGSRSSGEMAASQVFRAGQDATRANVIPFPRLNRTNAHRTEWLTGEVTRRQKQPDDPVAGHLHVAASCANREGVVRGCWR
jgi:hypothetical protein